MKYKRVHLKYGWFQLEMTNFAYNMVVDVGLVFTIHLIHLSVLGIICFPDRFESRFYKFHG